LNNEGNLVGHANYSGKIKGFTDDGWEKGEEQVCQCISREGISPNAKALEGGRDANRNIGAD